MIGNDLGAAGWSLLIGAATVTVFMALCLAWSLRAKKLTVVDTAWGLGFVLVAAVTAAQAEGTLRWVLLGTTAAWGIRLAVYLHRRNHGKDEDPRYQALAEDDGRSFARVATTRVFVPQGVAMWLVSTPIMVGAHNDRTSVPLLVAGLVVWGVGLFFESVGDAQLARFKADPQNHGRLMDQGLWRYTRHPNYFGDACVWTGTWIIVAGSWAGLATVISPIAMTIFLTKVTGAALNEKGMKKSKPGYDDYVRRTSGFIPWPPKQ